MANPESIVFEKEKDLVSVIICNYQKWPFIKAEIESITKDQTYKKRELILIDDGSSDSAAILEYLKLPSKIPVTFLPLPRRVGAAYAQNIGYYLSKGEFIMNLDGDDIAKPAKIEKQINFMIENDLDACGTNYEVFKDGGYSKGSGDSWLIYGTHKIASSYLNGNHCICWGTVMFKSAILKTIIGGSVLMPGAEDFDICSRIVSSGLKFDNMKEKLYRYRASEKQRSRLYYGKA